MRVEVVEVVVLDANEVMGGRGAATALQISMLVESDLGVVLTRRCLVIAISADWLSAPPNTPA